MENSEWITIDDDIDEHDDIGDWLVWILLIQHTCATLVKIILMIDSTQIALNSSSSCSSPSCSCKLLAQHQPVLDCLATPALARPPSLPTLLKENLNVAKQRPSPSANAAATRPPFFLKNFWHCSRSAKIRILLDFFFTQTFYMSPTFGSLHCEDSGGSSFFELLARWPKNLHRENCNSASKMSAAKKIRISLNFQLHICFGLYHFNTFGPII